MFLAIVAAAFGLRMLYVWHVRVAPGFDMPSMDPGYHDQWARAFAEGKTFVDGPYFRAPLYPLFLGLIYKVLGPDYLWARIIQSLIGSLSCGLLYFIGRDLFDRRVGLLAGFAAASYWILIYFDAELLTEILSVPLNLLMLYALIRAAPARRGWFLWGLAGLFGGLSAITRPNVLVFFPAVVIWIRVVSRRMGRGGLRPALAFGLGCVVPILPVTVRNYVVGRDFVLIASQGGVNFYIGNNPDSDGLTAIVPGTPPDWWGGYYASIQRAEAAEGRRLKPSEVSGYYSREAWRFINEQPGKWLVFMGKKLAYFWGRWEASNNQSIYAFTAHFAPFMRYLPLGFGLVGPLGLLGLFLCRSRGLPTFPLWGFVLIYMVTVVIHFFTARYRVPVVPPLIVLGSFVFFRIVDGVRERQWPMLARTLALLFPLLIVSNFVLYRVEVEDEVWFHSDLGLDYSSRGKLAEAEAEQRRVLALHPGFVKGYYDLGLVLYRSGRTAEALETWQHGLEVLPRVARQDTVGLEATLHKALGVGYHTLGRLDPAAEHFRRATECWALPNEHAQCWANLGGVLQAQGRLDQAADAYQQTVALQPAEADPHYRLALLLHQQGRPDAALSECREALRLDPAHAAAKKLLETLSAGP